MSTEIALIGLIAVILFLQRWKAKDCMEQVEYARRETQRAEQARCQQLLNNSFVVYRKAMVEGFADADYADEQTNGKTENRKRAREGRPQTGD